VRTLRRLTSHHSLCHPLRRGPRKVTQKTLSFIELSFKYVLTYQNMAGFYPSPQVARTPSKLKEIKVLLLCNAVDL